MMLSAMLAMAKTLLVIECNSLYLAAGSEPIRNNFYLCCSSRQSRTFSDVVRRTFGDVCYSWTHQSTHLCNHRPSLLLLPTTENDKRFSLSVCIQNRIECFSNADPGPTGHFQWSLGGSIKLSMQV